MTAIAQYKGLSTYYVISEGEGGRPVITLDDEQVGPMIITDKFLSKGAAKDCADAIV